MADFLYCVVTVSVDDAWDKTISKINSIAKTGFRIIKIDDVQQQVDAEGALFSGRSIWFEKAT
jgi:hypothetical protein